MLRLGTVCIAIALLLARQPAAAVEAGDACDIDGGYIRTNDTEGAYHFVCDGSEWTLSATFQKDGLIGIGTTGPVGKLDVFGGNLYLREVGTADATTVEVDSRRLVLRGSVWNGAAAVSQDVSIVNDAYPAGAAMRLYVGTANPLALFNGMLEVSGSLINPSAPLDLLSYVSDGATAVGVTIRNGHTYTTDGAKIVSFRNHTTEKAFIDKDGRGFFAGNVGIGKTSPAVALDVVGDINFTGDINDVSDRRMKENIQPLAGQLDKVTALEGVSFTMKSDDKTELGLIAQDVEKVYPELVKTMPDGMKTLNYLGLIAPLIEAVKEQQREIDLLRVENEALRGENSTLDRRLSDLETGSRLRGPPADQ